MSRSSTSLPEFVVTFSLFDRSKLRRVSQLVQLISLDQIPHFFIKQPIVNSTPSRRHIELLNINFVTIATPYWWNILFLLIYKIYHMSITTFWLSSASADSTIPACCPSRRLYSNRSFVILWSRTFSPVLIHGLGHEPSSNHVPTLSTDEKRYFCQHNL